MAFNHEVHTKERGPGNEVAAQARIRSRENGYHNISIETNQRHNGGPAFVIISRG